MLSRVEGRVWGSHCPPGAPRGAGLQDGRFGRAVGHRCTDWRPRGVGACPKSHSGVEMTAWNVEDIKESFKEYSLCAMGVHGKMRSPLVLDRMGG